MLTARNHYPEIGELIPHEGSMVLLHRILVVEEGRFSAAVDLERANVFRDETGLIPTFTGLEYLVQAICVMAGIVGRARGEAPRIGLLLGARNYHAYSTHFPAEGELVVNIHERFVHDPIAVLQGEIIHNGKLLVSGEIKAMQPSSEFEVQQIFAGS